MHPRIAPRPGTFFPLLFSIACGFLGCRGEAEPSPGGEPGAEADDAGADGLGQRTAAEFEKEFGELRGRISRPGESYQRKGEHLRHYIQQAKLAEARLGIKLPSIPVAEKLLVELKGAQEKAATEEYGKLEEAVSRILGEAAPDVAQASELVNAFPPEHLKDAAVAKKVEELNERLLLHGMAEGEAAARLAKLKEDDPVWNLAVLEGFDPQFDRTPFAAEIRKHIEENYKKYLAKRDARMASEKAVVWKEIDLREFTPLWPEGTEAVKVEEGVLSVGPNEAEYVKQDEEDLNLAAGTAIRIGDSEWIDVVLMFEAQVSGPEGIFFGARGHMRSGDVYNFYWRGLAPLAIADGDWHKLTVRIEEDSMVVTDTTGGKVTRRDGMGIHSGPFGIRVTGGKASIQLRKLQVQVLKEEAAPPREGGDESGKAKKKKKKAKKGQEPPKKGAPEEEDGKKEKQG